MFDARLMGSNERGVIPPRRVEVLIDGRWFPGELDRWSREPHGWYGRVRVDVTGHTRWFPFPDQLQKLGGQPPQ